MRLRRAIRRIAAARSQSKLWFGRYTSASLGGGRMPVRRDSKVAEFGAQLADMVQEYEALASAGTTEEDLAQFSDPRAHEMLTRWDMIASPPDILVTNYSMLNAMLMRELEQPLFTQTADWLRASSQEYPDPGGGRTASVPGHARQRSRDGRPEPAIAAWIVPRITAAAGYRYERLPCGRSCRAPLPARVFRPSRIQLFRSRRPAP